MADFLSAQWFAERDADLAGRGPTGLEHELSVVLAFTDAPAGGPQALTLRLDPDGGRVVSGDPGVADVVVTLSIDDARRLVEGEATSTEALREGRVSVRGDVATLVTLNDWLAARPK